MPITVSCPNCGHTVKAPDNAGGKKGKCPRCGGIVPIPDMPEILDDEDEGGFPPAPSGFAPAAAPAYPTPPPAPRFAPAAASIDDDLPRSKAPVAPGVLAMVVGKPANAWGYRASFGRTALSLTATRVIEATRRPIEERDCHILLTEVDSVEIFAKGNPIFIALMMMTWGLVAVHFMLVLVPIACAVLFFILKHRFLMVRSRANVMVVGLKGDERPFREFKQQVLAEVERIKFGSI